MKNDSDVVAPQANVVIEAQQRSMLRTMTWKKAGIAAGITLGAMIVVGVALYFFLVSPAGQKLQGQSNPNYPYPQTYGNAPQGSGTP